MTMWHQTGRFILFLIQLVFVGQPVWALAAEDYLPHAISTRFQNMMEEHSEDVLALVLGNSGLCFLSAESSYGLGQVHNCIVAFGPEDFRVWVMNQKIILDQSKSGKNESHKESAPKIGNSIHNLIATIVVKNSTEQPMAYYLELSPSVLERTKTVAPIPYKVPCVICHPSGPRLIRPSAISLKGMTESQLNSLKVMNDEISSYKIVQNYIPKQRKHGGLLPNDYQKHSQNKFKMPSCAECHNQQTGVRSDLSFAHRGTIAYQAIHSADDFGKPAMPAYGHRGLSAEELQCMESWLTLGVAFEKVPACKHVAQPAKHFALRKHAVLNKPSDVGRKKINAEHDYRLKSDLTAHIQTSLHHFEVSGLQFSGNSKVQKREKNRIEISGHIDFMNLKSGISVRDRHIKEALEVSQYPNAEIRGALNLLAGEQTHQLDLMCKDHSFKINVATNCEKALHLCELTAEFALEKCGIVPPSFLGIRVSPLVKISGKVAAIR